MIIEKEINYKKYKPEEVGFFWEAPKILTPQESIEIFEKSRERVFGTPVCSCMYAYDFLRSPESDYERIIRFCEITDIKKLSEYDTEVTFRLIKYFNERDCTGYNIYGYYKMYFQNGRFPFYKFPDIYVQLKLAAGIPLFMQACDNRIIQKIDNRLE